MPNATTSARSDSGRAMSGRIGMSLASTVSSVIDVPPTQSSGVARSWPAWTEAISSSRESKSVAAALGDARLVRLDDEPGPGCQDDDEDRDDDARAAPSAGAARPRPEGQRRCPRAAFVSASRTTMAGDPIVGISTNGMTRLPMMAPVVFTPSSSPDSDPAVPRSSRSSSEAVGKARPSTIVTGSTVRTADAEQRRRSRTAAAPGRATRGCEITRISPATLSTATAICDAARGGGPGP